MKKIFCLLLFLFLFGCYNGVPKINNKDNLSFEYQGYKIDTNIIVKSYHFISDDDYYIIKGETIDNHQLELKFKKVFNGYIKVVEKVNLNDCSYQYCFNSYMNEVQIANMKSSEYIDMKYDVEKIFASCTFKGYLNMEFDDYKDYLDNDFYVIENGQRRCDINKTFYIHVERLQ